MTHWRSIEVARVHAKLSHLTGLTRHRLAGAGFPPDTPCHAGEAAKGFLNWGNVSLTYRKVVLYICFKSLPKALAHRLPNLFPMAPRIDPLEAERIVRDAGLEPLEPYPGAQKPLEV